MFNCIFGDSKDKIFVSSGGDSYYCDCEDTVLYLLLKIIKDKHKWGD